MTKKMQIIVSVVVVSAKADVIKAEVLRSVLTEGDIKYYDLFTTSDTFTNWRLFPPFSLSKSCLLVFMVKCLVFAIKIKTIKKKSDI